MKFLHLEDNVGDANLIRDMLRLDWPDCTIVLARNAPEYIEAIKNDAHDLILSDYRIPGFSGLDALRMARSLRPDTPFIFVSGTVGEEVAAELVRSGASDYLLKDRMQRLPLAIQRALRESAERREHRVDQERLREQAELLMLAHDGIVVTDVHNKIQFWNRGAERIFGRLAAEVIGESTLAVFGPGVDSAFHHILLHASAHGEANGHLEFQNRRGEPIAADLSATLVRDADNRPKSQLCIITDVTEKRKLQEQFFRAQRLESLGMLAAGIAHDLNNALAPTLMASQLLRFRTTNPEDLRVLDILEGSTARGAALVKQILSFAAGGADEKTDVQLKHLLRDVVDMVRQTISRSILVETNIASDLWMVKGNATQLHQILLNLCINARDAMPKGGTLTLCARNHDATSELVAGSSREISGGYVVIEVQDTGTGIPPQLLTKIWEPFFTTKGEGKGTGLGLSTVSGIAAGHGGFVTVESEVGKGSCFRVYLPAVDRQVESGKSSSAHPFQPRGNGELIFVVDDDANIRETLLALLSQQGYRAITMADGLEALTQYAVRANEVALVITDIDMPNLDGHALVAAIRRVNAAAQILFISGTGSPDSSRQVAGIEGTKLLQKPFNPDHFLAAVRELVSSGKPAVS